MRPTRLRRAVLAGTAVLIAVSACGDGHSSAGSGHGSGVAAATGSAAPGAVFNDADVAFARHMIVHHRQAVEMAALAEGRAANARVTALAGQIKAAQDPEIATMSSWLGAWGQPVPEAGTHGHEAMPGMMSGADMTALADATGAAFDKRFLTMMIAHHEGAVTMAVELAATGSNPDAKALADKIVGAQRTEITTMKGLLAQI